MPINPGSRYPEPTKKDKVVRVAARNAVLVAYSVGFGVGATLSLAIMALVSVLGR